MRAQIQYERAQQLEQEQGQGIDVGHPSAQHQLSRQPHSQPVTHTVGQVLVPPLASSVGQQQDDQGELQLAASDLEKEAQMRAQIQYERAQQLEQEQGQGIDVGHPG